MSESTARGLWPGESARDNQIYLDVQMPELDGFEVLETVGVDRMPNTIFVTAHDKYALQAFEVHALDYLLKPYTNERFFSALERAKAQIKLRGDNNLNHPLSALLDHFKSGGDHLERLVVKAAGRISFVDIEEIDWIEAADTYVGLHVRGESYLVRGTMSGLESKLDPRKFLRIHRSTIVTSVESGNCNHSSMANMWLRSRVVLN